MRFCLLVKYTITLFMSIIVTFHIFQYRSVPAYVKVHKTGFPNQLESEEEPLNMAQDSLFFREQKIKFQERMPLQKGETGWVVLQGNITVHLGDELIDNNIPYVINAESRCESFDRNRTSLVIFIESTAENVLQRRAIRQTWGLRAQQDAHNFKVVFIIGASAHWADELITEENARYGDMVQINVSESSRILGLKSSVGLRWCAKYCNEADFYMKTDDDIIVHMPNLLKSIKSNKDPQNLLLCHENSRRKILRPKDTKKMPKKYAKYTVSDEELPGDFYPPYCSGVAYVFSKAILNKLLAAAIVTPVFFIEDVYITGFVRYKAGVNMTIHSGISVRPHSSIEMAACEFREGRITSQELKIQQMFLLWDEINTQGYFCPELLGFASAWIATMREKVRKYEAGEI